jgi:hypothetical protein
VLLFAVSTLAAASKKDGKNKDENASSSSVAVADSFDASIDDADFPLLDEIEDEEERAAAAAMVGPLYKLESSWNAGKGEVVGSNSGRDTHSFFKAPGFNPCEHIR